MNLPKIIDRRTLANLAAPNETHAVRVLMLKVSNPGVYTYKARCRTYYFEKNASAGCHVLDVPQSLWMAGINVTASSYRDNPSISHDFISQGPGAFVIQVVPWAKSAPVGAKEAAIAIPTASSFVEPLRKLLTKLKAPPVMFQAASIIEAGTPADLIALENSIEVAEEPPPPKAPPAEAKKRRPVKA